MELGASATRAWSATNEEPANAILLPLRSERLPIIPPMPEVQRSTFAKEVPESSSHSFCESMVGGRNIPNEDEQQQHPTARTNDANTVLLTVTSSQAQQFMNMCRDAEEDDDENMASRGAEGRSYASEFESVRAAISSQLLDATSQGLAATVRSSDLCNSSSQPAIEEERSNVHAAQCLIPDTVVLSASRPSCAGGPALANSIDAESTAAASVGAHAVLSKNLLSTRTAGSDSQEDSMVSSAVAKDDAIACVSPSHYTIPN